MGKTLFFTKPEFSSIDDKIIIEYINGERIEIYPKNDNGEVSTDSFYVKYPLETNSYINDFTFDSSKVENEKVVTVFSKEKEFDKKTGDI